jgi:tetratricopeptide (TPR) repeat protein
MDPHFLPAHLWLGLTYAQRSMYEEAIGEFQDARHLGPADGGVGYVYALQGRDEEAREVEEKIWERARHGYVPPAAFVWLYTAMGDTERALDWLEKAYEERDPWGLAVLFIDPISDPLRSEPRFQAIAREAGVPSTEAGG